MKLLHEQKEAAIAKLETARISDAIYQNLIRALGKAIIGKFWSSLKLKEDHDLAGTFSEKYLQPRTSNAKMTSFIHNLSFVE